MRFTLFILFSFILSTGLHAQIERNALPILQAKEDSLKALGIKIVESIDVADRFRSDSFFTRMLVRALRQKYSFYYPFDSLKTISRIYAPDSSFRIFTWQVSKDEDVHRRHGAIQMKTKDGSLKLYPLIDRTLIINQQADTVTNHEWWIGSIYYKIIQKEYANRQYYTLLGYDENSIRSTKKRIEVLHFDANGMPVFGGDFFSFQQDTVKKKNQSRFWIEYKKNGNGRILYDEELDLIVYDHLISETNEPLKRFTYIPDGDYEAFKWLNGKWNHIEKLFTFKLEDGQAPVEKPVSEKKIPVKKGG